MRSPLSKGTIIPLNGKEYHIDGVIGESASCIVYNVSTTTSGIPYQYRLKECYPYNAHCQRSGCDIIWADNAQKETAFARFKKAARAIAALRSEETIGNNITESELAEGNGTCYSIMSVNHAQTYNNEQSKDLHRILQTMLKLTRIVSHLHKQGYLHLDIKPENFLVNYDPEPTLWLFDVDSLVSIDELQSGTTTCYSYSKEWAAPELTQGKLNKVCPATDIYSVGAILFNKIMGRSVSNEDMGLFADWDFDGEIFENVNPKVHRYLREIFKKTLSVSVNRRYQTTAELVAVLELATHTISGVPFIQTESVFSTINFIGRENELREIEQAFSKGNQAVILHGFSGLGKSELAKAYAQQSKSYDVTLFIRYGKDCNSISEWLENLHIENCDTTAKENAQKAKALFDENTLIILDNFNIKPGEDNGLADLLRTKARVLVTTTTNLSDIYRNRVQQIEIGPLSKAELQNLFETISGSPITPADLPTFNKLLKKIEYHTYFDDLLARQLHLSGFSLQTLHQEVLNGFVSAGIATYVESTKDDGWHEDTIANIMRILFKLANLSDGQQQVLRNMCLLNFVQMTRPAYTEITGCNNLNDFNALVRLGYIQESNGVFAIHSLLNDLIRKDMTPCWDNCLDVFNYVLRTVNWFNTYDTCMEYTLADQDEAYEKGIFLYRFFLTLNFTQAENVQLCIDWVNYLYESDFFMADIINPEIHFLDVYSLLDGAVKTASPKHKYAIYFVLLKIWLRHCQQCPIQESEDDYRDLFMRQEQAIKYYYLAIKAAKALDTTADPTCERDIYIEISCNVDNTSMTRRMIEHSAPQITSDHRFLLEPGVPAEIVRHAYEAYAFHLSAWDKKYYGIPVSEEELSNASESFNPWTPEGRERDPWVENALAIEDDFNNAANKLQFLSDLEDSTLYNPSQKVSLIDNLLERLFDPISSPLSRRDREKTKKHIANTDWNFAEWLLDMQLRIVLDNTEYAWIDADEEKFSNVPIYRAILSALFDRRDFCDWMQDIEKLDIEMRPYSINIDFGYALKSIATACWNLGKCHLVLPYLVEDLYSKFPDEESEEYVGEYEEMLRECYDMICMVNNFALAASKEITELSKVEKCLSIHKKAEEMINQILGKKFEIKPQEE